MCSASPSVKDSLKLSEVTVQTQIQFRSFNTDFGIHRMKPLALAGPKTVEFGYLENFIGVVRK